MVILTNGQEQMAFEEIIGQEKVKKILTRMAQSNKMPHALLFHGPEGTGKLATALALAKVQFCTADDQLYCNECDNCKRVDSLNYSDLRIIFPAKSNYSQDDMREVTESIAADPYLYKRTWQSEMILIDVVKKELNRFVSLKSFENKGKVIIFIDAHRFKIEAENAFLKILEEPPKGVTYILITPKADQLLPTIISRCHAIKFDPLKAEEIKRALIDRLGASEQEATVAARMSFGNFRRAADILGEDLDEKQNLMLDMLRKILLSDVEIVNFGEQLERILDRRLLAEILELMVIWFHDAMILEQLKGSANANDKLIFANKIETLTRFVDTFEEIQYEGILDKINLSLTMINQNVQLKLVILNLLYELKRHLRRKKNV